MTNAILHVVVVGFHHKKGGQVEYSYPPLVEGSSVDSHEIPPAWKNLPSLALPDGSHNFTQDTIFFHLPAIDGSEKTLFGVSCYRQIDSKDLLHKAEDVTRNTVQKCVCVISTLPLYGFLQAKLELITHAYFQERDFAQVKILEDTYNQLNSQFNDSLLEGSEVFLGLSARELLFKFRHKLVVLFKLMMLERKVLFYGSPVMPVCSSLLGTLSLFPGMIENGLVESASYTPLKKLSSELKNLASSCGSEDFLEVTYNEEQSGDLKSQSGDLKSQSGDPNLQCGDTKAQSGALKTQTDDSNKTDTKPKCENKDSDKTDCDVPSTVVDTLTQTETVQPTRTFQSDAVILENQKTAKSDPIECVADVTIVTPVQTPESQITEIEFGASGNMEDLLDNEECFNWEEDKLLLEIKDGTDTDDAKSSASKDENSDVTNGAENSTPLLSDTDGTTNNNDYGKNPNAEGFTSTVSQASVKAFTEIKTRLSGVWGKADDKNVEMQDVRPVAPSTLKTDNTGFPLAIFTKGIVCHPYLSLQYFDLLIDPNVAGFTVGASNMLFKQKRHVVDVIIEILDASIDINDPELRKQLTLTTADLRFADHLVRSVVDGDGNMIVHETEWEGGEEWLRGQFKDYLLALLVTIKSQDEKALEDFGTAFITAWKTTRNYKTWKAGIYPQLDLSKVGHPFPGNLGVQDVKLKLSQTMQSTEGGKKISAAAVQTGRVAVQAGKAVGGAINTAKSAVTGTVTNWFRRLTSTDSDDDVPYGATEQDGDSDNIPETKQPTPTENIAQIHYPH